MTAAPRTGGEWTLSMQDTAPSTHRNASAGRLRRGTVGRRKAHFAPRNTSNVHVHGDLRGELVHQGAAEHEPR